MKKLLIALVICLLPFSVFAMETISTDDLNSVTGQAGIKLEITKTIDMSILMTDTTVAMTDPDTTITVHGAPNLGTTFVDPTTGKIKYQNAINVKIYKGAVIDTTLKSANNETTVEVGLTNLNVTVENIPTVSIDQKGMSDATINLGDMAINMNGGVKLTLK